MERKQIGDSALRVSFHMVADFARFYMHTKPLQRYILVDLTVGVIIGLAILDQFASWGRIQRRPGHLPLPIDANLWLFRGGFHHHPVGTLGRLGRIVGISTDYRWPLLL